MTRNIPLVLAACVTGLLLGTTALLQEADGAPGSRGDADSPAERLSDEDVAAVLARVDSGNDGLVSDWISLASVPAWSGGEERRAARVSETMRAMGLESVHVDPAGNVVGLLPGADRRAPKVAFMAHMDTVAGPDDDFTITREGDRLRGRGVRDDSAGLAALLAAARLVREGGLQPPADVFVVASVEEETGLNGSRAFLDDAGEGLGAFVAVDGYLGQVSYAATSIYWSRMHFKAPGSHTLRSHEHPSATLALARAVEGVYGIETARQPEEMETWINVGMLGGGEVPNAQARDAWFSVDLRSNDPETAEAMERRIREICEGAAASVGVAFEQETLQRLEGAKIPGHADSPIVRAAREALEALGWGDIRLTPRGTADHNIAIQRGIPAIAVGVTTGEGAHTPTEYADVGPYSTGVKQLVLLMTSSLY